MTHAVWTTVTVYAGNLIPTNLDAFYGSQKNVNTRVKAPKLKGLLLKKNIKITVLFLYNLATYRVFV